MIIAAKHGAYNIRVFGSVAGHEADSTSDIDLLVDMEAREESARSWRAAHGSPGASGLSS